MYQSTKEYGHNIGLSCAFRQWGATHSHCSKAHGYSIAVKLIFETDLLDERNWCLDFGSLKPVKKYLEDTFDHKTLIDKTDPELEYFIEGHKKGVLDLVIMDGVGCEKFAEHIYDWVETWMLGEGHSPRVRLVSVEVKEHGANSAIYSR